MREEEEVEWKESLWVKGERFRGREEKKEYRVVDKKRGVKTCGDTRLRGLDTTGWNSGRKRNYGVSWRLLYIFGYAQHCVYIPFIMKRG